MVKMSFSHSLYQIEQKKIEFYSSLLALLDFKRKLQNDSPQLLITDFIKKIIESKRLFII